jgi:3-methyladenine DNA glycosylase/8-oxoguanine DNA glycosylase
MKNSKDYSKKIQKLYRSLSRKYPKVQKVSHEKVIDAIIYAVISAEMSERTTDSVIRKFADFFVDLNDLRVSRSEEIVEVLGKDNHVTMNIASTVTMILNGIFNEYHKVSLEALKKIGKRPAKQALEKINGISRFVVDYCLLTALGGHAIPLTDKMIKYLKTSEFVNPDADEQQIGGFLAKQISAKNGYEFYALLRHESESAKAKKKTKAKKTSKKTSGTKTKSKTKTKAKKKTTRRKKA